MLTIRTTNDANVDTSSVSLSTASRPHPKLVMMETLNKRHWWRYLRLSLRSLLVLVLVIGGCLGWILHLVRSAEVQRHSVAAIVSAGQVRYDWNWKNHQPYSIGWLGWPQWLVYSLGVDYFGRVQEVRLGDMGSDEVLTHLRHLDLSRLEKVDLDRSPVTDAGLAHLSGSTGLMRLYLYHNKVTDAGLIHLQELTSLQWLCLDDNKVTDAGLVHLKGLSKLKELYLNRTRITDAGLFHLKALKSLEVLGLNRAQVTDAGLVHLKGLRNLQELDLSETTISDAGLANLEGLTNLKVLFLDGGRVGDAGLVHLRGLTNLRRLEIQGTRVTDTGLRELREALPNLKILH